VTLNEHDHDADRRRPASVLTTAAVLTAGTFVAEVLGGWYTGSVGLLSDAVHVFMDLASLVFALTALRLSQRPTSDQRTFGLHRLEVFAALANGLLVLAAAGGILAESLRRLKHPADLRPGPLLAIAAGGLAVNLFVAWRLRGYSRTDINLRAAFWHVSGDALGSVGVILAGILVWTTGKRYFDSLAGIAISVVISAGAFRVLRDSVNILLEATPPHLRPPDIAQALQTLPGIRRVEDIHLWNICSHISSLSAHLVLDPTGAAGQTRLLEDAHRLLRERFGVRHATLEVHWVATP
jgi:cobalt-zinc-cadmium efflux system protein